MIFQETWRQVLAGRKTQTRRVVKAGQPCRWVVGKTYAVQPARTQRAVGRIRITDVRRERLGDITPSDARAEGFDTIDEFVQTWTRLHGRFDPEVIVWVVTFEPVEPEEGAG